MHLRKIFHPLLNLYRRMRDGAGCCDSYGLNHFLAKRISRSLRSMWYWSFTYPSHPVGTTMEGWRDELETMAKAFEEFVDGDKDNESVQKGIDLFAKRFYDLWL